MARERVGPPVEHLAIDDAVKHLRRSLAKKKKFLPAAKAAMLCGFISHWWHQRLRGQTEIFPGKSKVAGWDNCDTSYAKRFLRQIESAGIAVIAGDMSGGRGWATPYQVDVPQLCRWLVGEGANPSAQLLQKLRDVDELCDQAGRTQKKGGLSEPLKGGQKGGQSPPRSKGSVPSPHLAAVACLSSTLAAPPLRQRPVTPRRSVARAVCIEKAEPAPPRHSPSTLRS